MHEPSFTDSEFRPDYNEPNNEFENEINNSPETVIDTMRNMDIDNEYTTMDLCDLIDLYHILNPSQYTKCVSSNFLREEINGMQKILEEQLKDIADHAIISKISPSGSKPKYKYYTKKLIYLL